MSSSEGRLFAVRAAHRPPGDVWAFGVVALEFLTGHRLEGYLSPDRLHPLAYLCALDECAQCNDSATCIASIDLASQLVASLEKLCAGRSIDDDVHDLPAIQPLTPTGTSTC